MDPKELRSAGNQNVYPVVKSGEFCEVTEWGLTKREHFAAMAMQGLCAHPAIGNDVTAERIAMFAVEQADALLRALAAGGEG